MSALKKNFFIFVKFSFQNPESKQYKTLTRVRKYEKDGKVVTETTSRIVDVSSEDYRAAARREQLLRYLHRFSLVSVQFYIFNSTAYNLSLVTTVTNI